MGRRKKITNNTNIPEHEIEALARCFLSAATAFFDSEEGQREFTEWKERQKNE